MKLLISFGTKMYPTLFISIVSLVQTQIVFNLCSKSPKILVVLLPFYKVKYFFYGGKIAPKYITVKPRNSGQLKQLDFFHYCGVFPYFDGSEALNRAFWGQNLSSISGLFAILTLAIAGFYCRSNNS